MIRVTEVREERLSILSTYVATLSKAGPREYYLAQETERLLEAVLTQLMEGDRETIRAFCSALYVEFDKELPFGRLHEIRSYRRDRRICFELEQEMLTSLSISHSRNNKEIVRLGIEKPAGCATRLQQADNVMQIDVTSYPDHIACLAVML